SAAQSASFLAKIATGWYPPPSKQGADQDLKILVSSVDPKGAMQAIATLAYAMRKTTSPVALERLGQALAALVSRVDAKKATPLCSEAAATLARAMSRTTNSLDLNRLAHGLSAVTSRMEPEKAAPFCSEAAATLARAMSKMTNSFALERLAEGLSAV